MKNYNKKAAINVIVSAAKEYNEKLRNNQFLILYQDGAETKSVSVEFRDYHFLHMTGVKSKISAKKFYSACIANKLAEKDFEFDTTGKVMQKLAVLPYLSDLLYNACMIGDYINSGIFLKTDYFVGNTRAVLSVGFRNGTPADFPVTLYNEDVRKLVHPTCKVLAIFKKKCGDKVYRECTYLAKSQKIENLKAPSDVIIEKID